MELLAERNQEGSSESTRKRITTSSESCDCSMTFELAAQFLLEAFVESTERLQTQESGEPIEARKRLTQRNGVVTGALIVEQRRVIEPRRLGGRRNESGLGRTRGDGSGHGVPFLLFRRTPRTLPFDYETVKGTHRSVRPIASRRLSRGPFRRFGPARFKLESFDPIGRSPGPAFTS